MDERSSVKLKKSKLEYSDEEPEAEEVDTPPSQLPTNEVKVPSVKKARSDAQKVATARMRVKLDERRKELIVIKQEAKATALLQQMELKANIKDKLKAKQNKNKAEEKRRQAKQYEEEYESEEEQSESEPEEVKLVHKRINKKALPIKQLPSANRPSYASQDFPSVRFV